MEDDDIFSDVELFTKSIDLYLFLFVVWVEGTGDGNGEGKRGLVTDDRTVGKVGRLLSTILQFFDTVFKGYEITKNIDRQRMIRSLIKHLYRQHF